MGVGTLWRPLHQGAPSPLEWAAWGSLRCRAQGGRLQLQPTRRTPAEKGEGMAGAVEEKPTKGASPSPSPSLWSSNSLILNLRLTPPPNSPSHPILTTQTHAQFMQLPLAPFLFTPSYEWPDWDKTQQQCPQEVPPLGAKH